MIAAGLCLSRPCDSDLFAQVSRCWSEPMFTSAGSPQSNGYDPATGPEPKPWIPPFHRCAEKEWLVCLPYSDQDKHAPRFICATLKCEIKAASKIFQCHTACFCFSMSQHQICRFFSQLFPSGHIISHHITSKVASGARSRVGSGSPRHSPRHSPRGSPRTSRVAMRRQDRVPKQHPGVGELENEMRMKRDESMCWWWVGFLNQFSNKARPGIGWEGFSLPSQDKDNAEDGPEAGLGKLGSQVG